MTPLLVGLSLIILMLLVHTWMQSQELNPTRPLDVDDGLPFPELAQASSVFSLTALYTAYLTMAVVLGLPALCGVVLGGVLSLVAIRSIMAASTAERYEELLMSRCFSSANGVAVMYVAIGAQIGFAISELLILREVAMGGFHMAPRHATVLMLAISLIPYYYCLVGGYRALFRTDVIQFVAVAIMCALIAFYGAQRLAAVGVQPGVFLPNASFWALAPGSTWLTGVTHAILGTIMGASFIAASPDTWKRVFVAVKKRKTPHAFWRLVIAGSLPFIAIAPLLIIAPRPNARDYVPVVFFFRLAPMGRLDGALIFGVLATFLSSFAGAVLSAAHLILLDRRRQNPAPTEMPRYQAIIGLTTLVTVFAALAFVARGNPYFIGYLLLGPYAIVGGAVMATRGNLADVAPWVGRAVPLLLIVWFLFIARRPDIIDVPSMDQLNGIPAAVALFTITFVTVAGDMRRLRSSKR
jgi:Na+/proline symporter